MPLREWRAKPLTIETAESGDPDSPNSHVAQLTTTEREYFYEWLWGITGRNGGTPLE